MVRSLALLVLGGAALINAAVVPKDEIALMKRNYIESLSKRIKLAKRQSVTSGVGDADVLNFALTLEHLEAKFYSDALADFTQQDFESAGYMGVYPLLQQVASDESEHVSFLTSALSAAGATPVEACTYNFPYTDVKSFLGLSQVLEGVGTSAYLGAAGSINNTAYLTAAGSILTVEARHAALVRLLNKYSPFPQPNDTPQSARAVVTLATPFFVSCPDGSAPTIQGFPALNVTTTAPSVGQALQIAPTNSSALSSSQGQTLYCGFASGLGAGFSQYQNGSCEIPSQNVTAGQTYVFITTGPSVSDDSVVAGPAAIQLGAMNFTISAAGVQNGGGNSTSGGSGSGGSGSGGSGSGSGSGSGGMGSGSGMSSGAGLVKVSGGLAMLAGAVVLLF